MPLLRAVGFAIAIVAVAIHNEIVFGSVSIVTIATLATVCAAYSIVTAFVRAPQFFHAVDIALTVLLIYVSGGDRSWLFFIALIPVMNQTHVSARKAFISGLWATTCFVAMLAYLRLVDGVSIDPSSAAMKTLLIVMFGAYCIFTALIAEENRAKIAQQLENERTEAEAREQYLAALNRVTNTISAELDLDRMLQAVTDEILNVFHASSSGISVLDDDHRYLIVKAFRSTNAEQRSAVGTKIPLENNPSSSYVVGTGRALVIEDAQSNPLTEPMHELIEELGVRCMMLAPFVSYGEVIGTIGVDTNDSRVFTNDELALLQTIAGQIAGPIGNARLFIEEKRSRELSDRLAATAHAIGASLEPSVVLSQILEQLQHVLDYDSGSIHMIEGDAMRIIAVRGLSEQEVGRVRKLADHPFNKQLVSAVEPFIIHLPDDVAVWNPEPAMSDVRTVLGVPLVVRDRVIGALTVDSRTPHAYSDRDGAAAMAFARQAAIAIDHAGLFASAREELNERRKAERELLEVKRQLEQSNLRLLDLSARDTLTGLPNRRRFDEVLVAEWRRAVRTQSPLSIMMIDIDEFKAYNDTYGHPRGDDVLRRVGLALGESMKRAGDFVARYGGEEFVVLLPSVDLVNATSFAEALRRRIEALDIAHAASVAEVVTISVGVATAVPRDADEASTLVAIADQHLYRAKRSGRNCVEAAEVMAKDDAPVRRGASVESS